jgi:hypothetical protein
MEYSRTLKTLQVDYENKIETMKVRKSKKKISFTNLFLVTIIR